MTITCKGMTYFLKCLNFLAGNISKCVKSLSISSTAISCRDAGGSVVLCGGMIKRPIRSEYYFEAAANMIPFSLRDVMIVLTS